MRIRNILITFAVIGVLLCCASALADTSGTDGDITWTLTDSLKQIRIPATVTTIPGDVFEGISTDSFIIFGTPGSAAQTFADNAGIVFVEE